MKEKFKIFQAPFKNYWFIFNESVEFMKRRRGGKIDVDLSAFYTHYKLSSFALPTLLFPPIRQLNHDKQRISGYDPTSFKQSLYKRKS